MRPDCEIKYSAQPVEVTHRYRYLGVFLDEHLTFDEYATQISSAGGRALGAVLNKTRFLKDMGHQTFSHLYHAGVAPVLDCGSEIAMLNKRFIHLLEKLQLRAGRFFLGVGRFSALCSINAEMGWRSCSFRAEMSRYRYYNRIMKMDSDRIPKKIYLESKETPGTWANEVGYGLSKLGEHRSWRNNVPLDLTLIREKLKK